MQFSYDSAAGGSLATPVAVGAKVGVCVEAGGHSDVTVASATVANPAIALVTDQNSLHAFTLRGLAPGTTELEVTTNRGSDRVSITVAAPDTLQFVDGWGSAPGPTVVVGATERYWVRLLHAGQPLAGNGATQFIYSGPIGGGQEIAAPGDGIPDSEENFAVGTAPGQATITAQSGGASTQLAITMIDASAVTSALVSLGVDHGVVFVTAFAGNTPVYGPSCTWSATDPKLAQSIVRAGGCDSSPLAPQFPDSGGWTGDAPGICYRTSNGTPRVHATCRLDPTTLTVPVDFN
jgi:hypothetical protein